MSQTITNEVINECFNIIVKYCKERKDRNASCIGCPCRKDYGLRQPQGCKFNMIDRPSEIEVD